jgi:dTDP-4-amino-4,6-dideoxygalactose transaminase
LEKFELELAAYVGTGSAIGVSSGTDALLVLLMALGVKPGDEVVTSTYSFFAAGGCIARLGARPVFADIDPDTFNLDPESTEAALTDRTVGIIPVHLFGQCAPMDPILKLAEKRDLWVVEDAAQAIGATYGGKSAGSMARGGTFSFFPAKNLGGLGDAGGVVTDDPALADTVRLLREHGSRPKFEHRMVGGNFRMDSLQAAFLSVKLSHLKNWEAGRRAVARGYDQMLSDLEHLTLPRESNGCRHVYNQYVVRSNKRDELRDALNRGGIKCAVFYPIPLHLQPCFSDLGYKAGDLPKSEIAAKQALAIPIDPLLEQGEQSRVVEIIRSELIRD